MLFRSKKGRVAGKMYKDIREASRIDGQRFESRNVMDYKRGCIVNKLSFKVEPRWRRLRTLDVGPGLVNVFEVQPGPQRGTRREHVPPATAHVGQRD